MLLRRRIPLTRYISVYRQRQPEPGVEKAAEMGGAIVALSAIARNRSGAAWWGKDVAHAGNAGA